MTDQVIFWLAANGPATLPEIARAVRKRDEDVRRVLKADPRFGLVPCSGRSHKARCWTVRGEGAGRVRTDAWERL